MLRNPYILAAITAIGAALWPAFAKASNAEIGYVLIAANIGSAIVGLLLLPGTSLPSYKGMLYLLSTCAVTIILSCAYIRLIQLPEESISQSLPLVSAFFALVLLINAFFILGEPITIKKIIGAILIAGGIILVRI